MRNRPIVTLTPSENDTAQSMVLWRADGVLALNKPAGLACEARKSTVLTLDRLLWAFARSNGKRPHLVHRLDAATSGVLLAAETKPMAAALSSAFEARTIRKTYLALVSGRIPGESQGTIRRSIRRVPREGGEVAEVCDDDAPGAKSAETHWDALDRNADAALLRLTPITGRLHQLRVHLAAQGMPILGDGRHGPGATAPRLMLHALQISGPVPEGRTIAATAPIPHAFSGAITQAGLAVPGDAV